MRIIRVGQGDYGFSVASLPQTLRIEKSGNQYTFCYKSDPGGAWTTLGAYLTKAHR